MNYETACAVLKAMGKTNKDGHFHSNKVFIGYSREGRLVYLVEVNTSLGKQYEIVAVKS